MAHTDTRVIKAGNGLLESNTVFLKVMFRLVFIPLKHISIYKNIKMKSNVQRGASTERDKGDWLAKGCSLSSLDKAFSFGIGSGDEKEICLILETARILD